MFLNSILEGLRMGTADRRRKQTFDYLENTPFLHSSGYLNELFEQATEKEDFESILEHLYKHDALEVPKYKAVERRVMESRYWDD